ncbi:hypothetical protein ACFLUO_06685 [Chloroflexota bacterium]
MENLQYKSIERPKITRGTTWDATKLIGNVSLGKLNVLTYRAKAEVMVMLWLMFCPKGLIRGQII